MSKSRILIALALVLTACGSDEGVVTQATSAPSTAGGSASSTTTSPGGNGTGGSASKASGGSSVNVAGSPSTIGTGTTGGSSSVNTSPTGGTSTVSTTVGGSASSSTSGSGPLATGGTTPSTGGTSATGGSTGRTPSGGSTSTGGSSVKATGGTPATGGSSSNATGGSTTQATGGSPSTGGTTTQATGGSTTTATGGSSATGGASTTTATGGSNPSTGGTPATGGTTTVVIPVPTQVSVGTNQTCATLSDGHVKCWGTNNYGQLGNGTTTDSATPVVVSGISNAIQVSTGFGYTCALLADGTVKCWGRNHVGQLGNGVASLYTTGTDSWSTTPVQIVGVTGAVQVSAGRITTCVLLANHTVKCVGFGGYGELGDGVITDARYHSTTLVQVIGINNATSVQSGLTYFCALLSDKTIKCWGGPTNGEFATDSNGRASTPVLIPNVSNAVQLSVGNTNICFIADTNQAFCWGTQNNSTTPTLSFGAAPYEGISLLGTKLVIGSTHGCGVYSRPALTSASVVFCWGSNSAGELGDGTTTASNGVVVSGITDATDIAIGGSTSCAILKSGTMKCWGQLTGNSSSPTSSTPVIPDGF